MLLTIEGPLFPVKATALRRNSPLFRGAHATHGSLFFMLFQRVECIFTASCRGRTHAVRQAHDRFRPLFFRACRLWKAPALPDARRNLRRPSTCPSTFTRKRDPRCRQRAFPPPRAADVPTHRRARSALSFPPTRKAAPPFSGRKARRRASARCRKRLPEVKEDMSPQKRKVRYGATLRE